MNMNFFKELIDEINNSNIEFFYYCSKEITLKITKKASMVIEHNCKKTIKSLGVAENQAYNEIAATTQSEAFKEIKSQYVGTIKLNDYKTLNPYVRIGQNIEKGDILCVIEYLNIPIEVKSDVLGVISSINVKENEIVDYGKILFEIRIKLN